VVDLTQQEKAAIATAMTSVAEIMAEIGWMTRLNELSELQVLTLIECAVGSFQDAMHATVCNGNNEVPF
jgi:hypothetical protein